MNRLTLLASLTAIAIVVAGCSAASGPTYNAYSVDASDGVRTYRVECGGIFETAATCTKVAERICGNKSVQPIEKIDRLRDASDATADPRTMDFKCESAARVQGAVKTAPAPNTRTIESFALQSDALFAFDKSSLDSMLPAGKADLDKAIEQIKTHEGVADIAVVGHTDRIGSPAVNQRLSEARADTVRAYLIAHGLDGSLVHAQGMGSSQPISHCPAGYSRAVIACLQPDRRVSIEVKG
ncbi:OmpA family protein [Caballeronia mineralivorans]|uniref:OmpA family protein n=1 Tax=Caballeronia mineralivorans TaxID=2010198 RepID=UPI0023F08848|nr:OmpA family protein [Caballeronia mineralivorans]MDB5783715.1 flagellar motor protein MotB [Caballeronia mineralivorans]